MPPFDPNAPRFLLPLNAADADLANVGGKGANLSRLSRAGFPVPSAFLLTVTGYGAFVEANCLDKDIFARLENLDPTDTLALDEVSCEIRQRFHSGTIPTPLAQEILSAYRDLDSGPVAVRSSATAEDLPEASFAGQQDTFLNVVGEDPLLLAVVQCWSSLWTARAIGYRIRNHLDHRGIALAVIVQRMVESQVSGVLFTANPLTGLRSETVIDAAFGLGEALVSGQVEPDHMIVDPAEGIIRSKTLGRKAISIHGQKLGGTQTLEKDRSDLQTMPDTVFIELASLGKQVADLYGSPQDIEWAWADGKLYLLQSRPITSLYPLPPGVPANPLKVFFSFGAVQGMLEPLTPLGADALNKIFAAGAGLFGIKVTGETQTVLYEAGERLWVNFTPIVSNSFGRQVIKNIIGMLEPTIGQALEEIWDDPRLLPKRKGVSPQARLRLARFLLPLAGNVLLNFLSPRHRRGLIIANGERVLTQMDKRSKTMAGGTRELLSQRAALFDEVKDKDLRRTLIFFVSAVVAGMASWNLIRLLNPNRGIPSKPENQVWSRAILELTRGMPHNPTTEMDLALWEIARDLRTDSQSMEILTNTSSKQLSVLYLGGQLPTPIQTHLASFLLLYGGRGLGEIDMGRPRWANDPTHVFEMLASFMRIDDPNLAPDVVFARGKEAAQAAVEEMSQIARAGKFGWLRAAALHFLAHRAREWMGMRENPKFFAVRMMAIVQRGLLDSGKDLVRTAQIDRPDDLVFLTFDEIRSFAAGEPRDWREWINSRRQSNRRETLRKQIPRLLLSDGRAFYGGMSTSGPNAISGSPVSPGSATGRVRVVLNPSQANLIPGEILVCPGTDPSWTPLFLSAAGLVMEVGGMMTHGAVVAREYGIPAIVGVHEATQRVKNRHADPTRRIQWNN